MMYDENKWNENENEQNPSETVVDSTEEEQVTHSASPEGNTQVDSESGTYRWSKYQDQNGPASSQQEENDQQYRSPYPKGYYENPNSNPSMNRQQQSGYNYQSQNYQYQNRPNYQYQGGQNQPPKKKGSLLHSVSLQRMKTSILTLLRVRRKNVSFSGSGR